jgi:F-type H+-transporting ATPase subunit b
MNILQTFGVDPVLLGAQIINFLIIFFLLKKFLYKPILDMLKKRRDKIQEGINQAEEAQKTLEKTLEEEKKILAKAHTEAKAIVEDAKEKSLETTRVLEENAKNQAEKIIAQAKLMIEQESKDAEGKLTQKITLIASDLLTKALEGVINEKDQKQIIDKTLGNIKKIN